MIKIFIAVLFLSTCSILRAQEPEKLIETRPLNGFNINIFGDGSFVSVSYEKQLPLTHSFIVSAKTGIGYNQEFNYCAPGPCTPSRKIFTIPLHLTGNFGKEKHFFEFGLGATIFIGNTFRPFLFYPILGYRFLPLTSGRFNCRVFAHMPFSGFDSIDFFFMPIGFSFGTNF